MMNIACAYRSFAAAILFVFATVIFVAATPIDSTLSTTYTMAQNGTNVDWVVCGSLPGSIGCYGAGSMGPFAKIGALIEGNTTIKQNTVTRLIYVVDVNVPGNTVVLNVFKKIDVINGGDDTVSVTPFKSVTLPLTGGIKAHCFMAANKKFLFIGTDQSTLAVEVSKKDLSMTGAGGFDLPVTEITGDKYGFVTITQGTGSGSSGFTTYDPNGRPSEDGGGAPFMLNPINAVLATSLP
jgi:hypothetical protein